MFGSDILEVAVGLSLIYLLMSALCSAVRELVEAFFKTRAAELERGIREMLHAEPAQAKKLVAQVYEHPLIRSLYRGTYAEASRGTSGRSGLPSYIPSANFAVALLQKAPHVVETALGVAHTAGVNTAALQANVEAWYDSVMDRVSGWYKRRTQVHLFVLGLVLAVAMNVDTIHLVKYLLRNDAARAALVHRAETADSTLIGARFDTAYARLDSLGLPIGWAKQGGGPEFPVLTRNNGLDPATGLTILGWLLTAFAITLGAPFWFDVLNRIMVIRSTVKPHEKSPEEGSEDGKDGAGGGTAKHVRLAGPVTSAAAGQLGSGSAAGPLAPSAGGAADDAVPAGEEDLVDAAVGGGGDVVAGGDVDLRDVGALGGFADADLGGAPENAELAAAAPQVFNAAKRTAYVDSILKNTDRFDFLCPARQAWDGGDWWHSFERNGKIFRVAASWARTKDGTLSITQPTREGKAFSSGRATFCNFNVSYCFHEAYGGPCLQFANGSEHSANQLIDLLTAEWKNVSAAEAARIANKGGFVIAGRKASPHGHVVFLLEGSDEGGDPAKINAFHVGGGEPRKRTVANIWGSAKVEYVTPPATFKAWKDSLG